MKSMFALVVMILCLSPVLQAQRKGWYEDMKQIRDFLDRQDVIFESYSVALGDAYYDYYSGVLPDPAALETLKTRIYVERDSIKTMLDFWLPKKEKIKDSLVSRRMIQWNNILTASTVNDVPEIRDLQSALEKWLVAPDTVKGKPAARELERMAIDLISKRNATAIAMGFQGYTELVLQVTGSQPDSVMTWLELLDSLTMPPFRSMVEEMKELNSLEQIGIQDVFRIYFPYFQSGPPEPPREERQEIITSTLNALGMKYEELPILQREMQLPPPMAGQGIAVRIPDNFKLVVSPNVDLSTVFHEVGHGLACVYTTIPCAVIKGYEWVAGGTSPIMAEGLAEWASGILRNPAWMKKHAGLSDEEITGKTEAYKKYAPVNIRFWLYNVWLELEIFRNPAVDLDSLRTSLLKHFLLVDKPSSRPHSIANSMYVSYPVYTHNYLFAEVIKWQIHRELERRLGPDYLSNPQTAALMQEYFYKNGEYYPWEEKLRRFTGKGLDIEGYMQWLQGE